MDYHSLLNEEQVKPVLDTEGAVLVLAGAGSGKTRVLTYRVAYLLDELKVSPYNILAITFTNKAAKEMAERVESVTNEKGIWISTFHSFCARVLRNDIEHLGDYDRNFSIFTTNDSARLVSRILKEQNIEDDDVKKNIRAHISNAKNQGLDVDTYCNSLVGRNTELIREVFKKYEEELIKNNALDFDDLLLKTVKLFAKFPEVLRKYQERFRYIHIDEFQDTNKIQMLLVRMLAHLHKNIFVVGDDDQSIYGWRGAEVGNIINFKKYFEGCKVYKLQQNYRSTGNILAIANRVIKNNSERMGKELWTDSDKGTNVVYHACYNDKEEVDYVLQEIRSLVMYNGYSYSDFAILVRANSLTRNFEDKMNMYGIKYKLIGGFKFYDRKEIQDTLAYLRIVANPRDEESLTRIINFPRRGIGDASIEKLRNYSHINNMTMIDALLKIEDNPHFNNASKNKFVAFRDLLVDLTRKKLDLPFSEFITYMLEKIDFYSVYDIDNPEERNKLENIDELVTVIKEFCKENEGASLEDFMQSVALISDNEGEEEGDFVTIATIHGVKGLEYNVVFLVGLEENIFPSSRSADNKKELEEERRCMYVAITRARKRLYMTSASNRFRFGRVEYNRVSRFVEEAGLIEKNPADFKIKEVNKYEKILQGNAKAVNNTRPSVNNSFQNSISKDISMFNVGTLVVHSRYGEGIIKSRDGDNATIEFKGLGAKNFNLKLAPLKIK